MKDEVWRQWLQRSRSNLTRAELGRQNKDILFEDLCFDAQQAAEKALKSILAFYDVDIPRTHSIGYLIKLISESCRIPIPDSIKGAVILSDYAVTVRYPGDWEPVEEAEYTQAVLMAREVYQWALSIVSRDGGE